MVYMQMQFINTLLTLESQILRNKNELQKQKEKEENLERFLDEMNALVKKEG